MCSFLSASRLRRLKLIYYRNWDRKNSHSLHFIFEKWRCSTLMLHFYALSTSFELSQLWYFKVLTLEFNLEKLLRMSLILNLTWSFEQISFRLSFFLFLIVRIDLSLTVSRSVRWSSYLLLFERLLDCSNSRKRLIYVQNSDCSIIKRYKWDVDDRNVCSLKIFVKRLFWWAYLFSSMNILITSSTLSE